MPIELTEATYRIPTRFRTLVFDTYALYALWWDYGSGRGAYGYPTTPNIRPGNRTEEVDHAFQAATLALSKLLLLGLYSIIADEAANGEDPLYAEPTQIVNWCGSNGLSDLCTTGVFQAPTPEDLASKRISTESMATFFMADFWGAEGSLWDHSATVGGDVAYDRFDVAGENWANICHLTHRLRAAFDRKSEKDCMFALDQVLHVHHNNGSIFNRPQLKRMQLRLTQADLDLRAKANSVEEFLPLVSPQVAGMIRSLGAGETPVPLE